MENIDAVFEAQREVDEALAEGRGPGGMSRAEVEAQFAALETGSTSEVASPVAPNVEEELSALKKKYRVQT